MLLHPELLRQSTSGTELWQPNHTGQEQWEGERWSACSLPAGSIRLLNADGHQRDHVDTSSRDPAPLRDQQGGESASRKGAPEPPLDPSAPV